MTSRFPSDVNDMKELTVATATDSPAKTDTKAPIIIDLGKQLPAMPDSHKREDLLVRGCQSQVWLDWREHEGTLRFEVDSDAHIVRGLIAIILSAFNDKTPQQILDYDIDAYFARLDLLKHLSPTRGNGLRAMVQRVRDIAANVKS